MPSRFGKGCLTMRSHHAVGQAVTCGHAGTGTGVAEAADVALADRTA